MHYLIVESEVVMKTALLRTTLLILVATLLNACGSNKGKLLDSSNSTVPDTTSTTTTTTTTTSVTWPYSVSGDTVAFVPVSWEEMNSYVGLRPLNNPSNAMININMAPVSGLNIYAGTVRIGYTDTNQFYYGEFKVGDGQNQYCQNCYNNGDYEAGYNYWATINGKNTLLMYVQDQYGALIIAIDNVVNSGDGSGSAIVGGRVYYKNFAQSVNPQSPYRDCWYIYSGPYACAAPEMANKSSATVFDGYRLLGSFSGLQSYKALQQ
jgi:hypothetical protein